MSGEINLLSILAEDREIITYRPRFAKLTGNVLAAILLQQIIYWHNKQGGDFYKFKAPCSHEWYRQGDSWCEELSFTRREFDTALSAIGTKIVKGVSKQVLFAQDNSDLPVRSPDESVDEYLRRDDVRHLVRHIVIYWTDNDRVTWYHVNARLLNSLIGFTYESTNPPLYSKGESVLSFTSETTTETTTETACAEGAQNAHTRVRASARGESEDNSFSSPSTSPAINGKDTSRDAGLSDSVQQPTPRATERPAEKQIPWEILKPLVKRICQNSSIGEGTAKSIAKDLLTREVMASEEIMQFLDFLDASTVKLAISSVDMKHQIQAFRNGGLLQDQRTDESADKPQLADIPF